MEREEREQIPWSSLVPQGDDRIDKRWYAAGVLVLVAVLGVIGFRLSGGVAQPVPTDVQQVPADASSAASTTTAPASMIMSEDELVRGSAIERTGVVATRAEWFVMDFFTIDGSPETVASVRAALAPELRSGPLPHDDDGDETFVEWARAVAIDDLGDRGFEVTVVYRAIRSAGDGYNRDPVRAVTLPIDVTEGALVVTALPMPIGIEGVMVTDR